ncbi:MAG: Kae1-associated serine/threonine protein kinase, partial [Candidatus Aenigmarchaeota archaeon]|nr:Kae1-associated serine/threonine protein kinase [Candidatus Aenigmarchaeota archaeon]
MIIAQGAEAVLRKEDGYIIKERVMKGYRIPQLDSRLRRERTKHEEALMREARRLGVAVPAIAEADDYALKMDFIDGLRLKDILSEKNMEELGKKIGENISRLHTFGIIHGDLTTSNMLLYGSDVYFIDFGLGFHSRKIEDKAVDLHLLRQALNSTHSTIAEEAWRFIIESYDDSDVLRRIIQIE